MHRAIDDLTEVVEKQIQNYGELKRLILEKRKAIVSNDLRKLSEATGQIQNLIASNNQLEMGRMQLVKKMAEELDLRQPKITLTHLAKRFESPISDKLMDLRRRAVAAIREVQRQNRINAEMLKYCADLMDSIVRRLVDAESERLTYGSRGETREKVSSASLLDQSV